MLPESEKSKIKVPANLVPDENPYPGYVLTGLGGEQALSCLLFGC